MSNSNRVFITGYSVVSPSGETAEKTWESVLSGHDGIEAIKNWDVSSWSNQLAGELKDFKPAKMLPDKKLAKVISRQDVIGINAAVQAVEHSDLMSYRESLGNTESFNDSTGVYVGSPGNKYYQQYDFLSLLAKSDDNMPLFAENLFSEVHPMWLLRILPNNVLAYTGITYGFKGPNHNITNHAAGGMQAIIEAYQAIRAGLISRAVVVGYDVGPEPQSLFYYDKLGVLSANHLKPFDKNHDGTILAEGAAALVLESEQSVHERGAKCYSEVMAGITATEAQGLFAIEETGAHLKLMVGDMLEQFGLSTNDFGMIVAHGNGNPKSDISEASAYSSLFGKNCPPVTAFKWSMGHTLCASGVIDTALATMATQAKLVPGIANLEQPARACESLNVSKSHREYQTSKPYSLVLNRGFGSINASLVLKHCD